MDDEGHMSMMMVLQTKYFTLLKFGQKQQMEENTMQI